MAWYKTGTVSVTNASTSVTGSGTNFVSGAQVGEAFQGPDGELYEITAIGSATSLTITPAYGGSTASGQSYAIVPTQSLVADLASDVADLISDYQTVVDEAGAGKFGDGSAASPSIKFTQDQDTGFFRDTANEIAISAGGSKIGSFKASGLNVDGTVTADGLTVDGNATVGQASGADRTLSVGSAGALHFDIDTVGTTGRVYLNATNDSTAGKLHIQTADTDRLFVNNNGDISFYEDTGTTAKFFWDASAESLGIGTSSPDEKLEVYQGNIKLGTDTNTTSKLIFERSAANRAEIYVGSSNQLQFDVGSSERMRIDSSGNVGIGTSSPETNYKLDVAGWGTFTHPSGDCVLKLQTGNNTGGSYIYFGDTDDADAGAVGYQHTTNHMYFRINAAERMRIDSSGNVGIGTNNPASVLSVRDDSDTNAASGTGAIRIQGGASLYSGYIGFDASTMSIGTNNASRGLSFAAGGSERMRIDSSGNLLVGRTSLVTTSSSTDTGHDFRPDGAVVHYRSNDPALFVGRQASDGSQVYFYKNGSRTGRIVTYSGSTSFVGLTNGIFFNSHIIAPVNNTGLTRVDNVMDVGQSAYRFDDIYATNGTIQTSDENEKQQIASLTDAEITAAKAISKLFKTFKWNDSVTEKGDAARTHTGVIAQQVETAMTDAGLNAGDYAFFISTTWWETQTDVPAVEADEENGVEAQEAYTRTDTYDTAEEAPEGATERNRRGIRYPQLLSFVAAATEQRLASIETRLDALEA